MKVGKTFTFEAAHFLPGHPKCGQMHGHSYKVEVTLEGPMDLKTNMVVDFGELSAKVAPFLEAWDHKVLNEVIGASPTAEHLCWLLGAYLTAQFSALKVGVKVWETATSWAEL